MRHNPERREFLADTATAVALGLGVSLCEGALGPDAVHAAQDAEKPDANKPDPKKKAGPFRRAVKFHMIDGKMSIMDKFKLLADLGFDGVEPRTRDGMDVKDMAKEMIAARDATGVEIHGVVNSSDPDIDEAVDLAKALGASSVLVVAGRVDEQTAYDKNYDEWLGRLRKAAPHAEKQGIKLLVENVWNNFLLSPLEMARFIDEVESPAAGVYFDVGNVVRNGWPEQWIRILGKRIVKLDIKEYSREKQLEEGLWKGFGVEIGEGSIDWKAVREELQKIGYSGWATAEVKGGDRKRLEEIAHRMNEVLNAEATGPIKP